MTESEILRTPFDRGRRLPRHRHADGAFKPAAFWHAEPALDLPDLPPGEAGQYPRGFIEAVLPWIRARASEILHVCSGSLPPGQGIRVDLRPERRPDVVADGRRLPFADGSVAAVMLDPPYSVEYAEVLYGTSYPRPSDLLREAARVVRPGGRVGFMHLLVPRVLPAGLRLVRVLGITTGLGYRIRAFTVLERPQHGLSLEATRSSK